MSLCFIIPVKLDIPEQEFQIKRCLDSIRRIYPTTKVVIAVAKNSLPLTIEKDSYTEILENPYFSTWGCLHLFNQNRYAEKAVIIHDSVVLLKEIPELNEGVMFIYHFMEPTLDRSRNDEGYNRLLPVLDRLKMFASHDFGCFGNMFYIHSNVLESCGMLPFIPKIKTKYDFECMERISAYYCKKNKVLRPEISMCGIIQHWIADPWIHTEYADKDVDYFKSINFPFVFAKSIIARK